MNKKNNTDMIAFAAPLHNATSLRSSSRSAALCSTFTGALPVITAAAPGVQRSAITTTIKATVAPPQTADTAVNTGYVDTTRPRTVIITGASSSIGLAAAKELAAAPDIHVVMACRNIAKGAAAAEREGLKPGSYTIRKVDLTSLASVRQFVSEFQQEPAYRALSALVCNAAIWYPKDKSPKLTPDGFDETIQVNHLSQFLLINLLLPRIKLAQGRIVFLATATHDPDSIAGKVPPQANLGDLSGMEAGMNTTIDGKSFEPTKSYKDSKCCNILTMMELHRRHGKDGVISSAVFPGCVAESELFREKRGWFRWFFPLFQKYVTRQFVATEEAGRRVATLASDPNFGDSGKYWQWTGNYLAGTADTTPTPIQPTEREADKAGKLWDLSAKLVGL